MSLKAITVICLMSIAIGMSVAELMHARADTLGVSFYCNGTLCAADAICNNASCVCPDPYRGDGVDISVGGTGCTTCGNDVIENDEDCDGPIPCCVNCKWANESILCTPEQPDYCVQEYRCQKNEYDIPECQVSLTKQCPVGSTCLLGTCRCDALDIEYCGNGVCELSENCTTCPSDCPLKCNCRGFLCPNGKCVSNGDLCVVACDDPSHFRCANNTCVEDFNDCAPNPSCPVFTCWDGTCKSDIRSCTKVPGCPVYTHRRCGGRCINSSEECTIPASCPGDIDNITKRCVSGNCRCVCERYFGCGFDQVMCRNGTCVKSTSLCERAGGGNSTDGIPNCPTGTIYCSDGTCAETCEIYPWDDEPVAFSQFIRAPDSAIVTVLSRSGALLGRLLLDNWTFAYDTTLYVSPVSKLVINSATRGENWGNYTTAQSIFSSIIDYSLRTDTQPFLKNITVMFTYNASYNPSNLSISKMDLGYITSGGAWESQGDLVLNNTFLVGYTNHFTPYTTVRDVHFPVTNNLDDFVPTFESIGRNNTIIYILAGTAFIFALAFLWSIRADRAYKSDERKAGEVKESGTELSKVTVSVGNNGWSPSSPSSVPSAERWGDNPEDIKNGRRGRGSTITKLKTRSIVVKKEAKSQFREKHKWLSIYFTPRVSLLSRSARVMVLLCMVLANMTVTSLFYNSENHTSVAQTIVTGIVSSVISFGASFLILLMFTKTPKRRLCFAYLIGIVFCLGCAFITIWLNLSIGSEESQNWCKSAAIAVVQDGLVNEPFKIFLLSFLVGFFPGIPFLTVHHQGP